MVGYVATIGELRALIKDLDDNQPFVMAGTPDVNGWVSPLLACLGRFEDPDAGEMVVLALAEESAYGDEQSVTYTANGQTVRPV